MLPKIFPILSASAPLKAIIGSNPVRAFRHGTAPQDVAAPYVTWSLVVGVPENTLDGLPRVDGDTVQMDCWSENTGAGALGVETLAATLRDVMESQFHMTSFTDFGRDPDTQRYRISLTFTVWAHRD